MAAIRFDFVKGRYDTVPCEQGATFRHSFIYKIQDPNDPTKMIGRDFTGWTAAMQVRKTPGSPTILSLVTAGGEITMGADGSIALFKSALLTQALTPGLYRYDLEVYKTSDTAQVDRLYEGAFEIVAQITT